MVASPLPDRERRHLLQFYLAPKMGYRTRLILAGSLMVIGFAIQLLGISSIATIFVLSVPFLLAGNLFLLVRGFNLKPQHSLRKGEWQKTTRDRFAKMRQLEEDVKRWDETFTDLTCVSGVIGLCAVLAAGFIVFAILAAGQSTRYWAPLFVGDAAVLLLPHWITGTRRGWRPVALRQQINSLETALGVIDRFETPACQVQPMFEMAGEGDRQVPINARVFIRFPDGPEEFLGLQFQVALNDVQGTKFPYLYAVVVAKKEFDLLHNYLSKIRVELQSAQKKPAASGFLSFLKPTKDKRLKVEGSREADVEVIVIRQHTTKTSGYHTDALAVKRIAHAAWQSAAYVLAHSPRLISTSDS